MSEVDILVGQRIRAQRKALGQSQAQLADQIGITYHQVQKYEAGTNRVAAPTLWLISKALGVRVSFFFDGLSVGETMPTLEKGGAVNHLKVDSPRLLRLIRVFRKLEEDEQGAVVALVSSISDGNTQLLSGSEIKNEQAELVPKNGRQSDAYVSE